MHPVAGPLGCGLDHTYIQTSLEMALSRRFALGSPGGEVLATAVMGFIVRSGEGGEERGMSLEVCGVHSFGYVVHAEWGNPLRGRCLCSGRGHLGR